MELENDSAVVVWDVWSGKPQQFGDRNALFASWSEFMATLRKELTDGRWVLVERVLMTQAEWDALEPSGDFELV